MSVYFKLNFTGSAITEPTLRGYFSRIFANSCLVCWGKYLAFNNILFSISTEITCAANSQRIAGIWINKTAGWFYNSVLFILVIVFILLISLSTPGQRVINFVASTSCDFPGLFVTRSLWDGLTKSVSVFPLTLRVTCEHATQFWSQVLSSSLPVDCMSWPDKSLSLPFPGNGRREALSMHPTVKPLVVILVIRCAIQREILYVYIYIFFLFIFKVFINFKEARVYCYS